MGCVYYVSFLSLPVFFTRRLCVHVHIQRQRERESKQLFIKEKESQNECSLVGLHLH